MLYMRGVDCFCTGRKRSLLVKSSHITSNHATFAKGVDHFCNDNKLNVISTKNASSLYASLLHFLHSWLN